MNTLVLDCSFGGVAIGLGAGGRVYQRLVNESRASDALLPLLQQVLDEAGVKAVNISRVVVTLGPGSFTGIRLGLAVAEGLRLAHPALDIQGVGTLPALARQVVAEHKPTMPFTLLLDAAGGMVYRQDFSARGKPLRVARAEPLGTLKQLKKFLVTQAGLLAPFATQASVQVVRPETLLALAEDKRHHLHPRPLYVKELNYKQVP